MSEFVATPKNHSTHDGSVAEYTLSVIPTGPIKPEALFTQLEELKQQLREQNPDIHFKEDLMQAPSLVGSIRFRRGIKKSTVLQTAIARGALNPVPELTHLPPPVFLNSVNSLYQKLSSSPSRKDAPFWIDLLSSRSSDLAQAMEAGDMKEGLLLIRDVWAATLHLLYTSNSEAQSNPHLFWMSELTKGQFAPQEVLQDPLLLGEDALKAKVSLGHIPFGPNRQFPAAVIDDSFKELSFLIELIHSLGFKMGPNLIELFQTLSQLLEEHLAPKLPSYRSMTSAQAERAKYPWGEPVGGTSPDLRHSPF